MNVHDIRPSRDKQSPVHIDNKVETCRQCHTHADNNYAGLDPHPSSKKEASPFRYYASSVYDWIGNSVIVLLMAMGVIETVGRRRDGACWLLTKGSSWWRKSKKSKDRIV